jgi:glycosyltransferase involved in cell wall biosynthesis
VPNRIAFEHGDLYLNSLKFRAANFVLQRCAQRILVCREALTGWARSTYGLSAVRASLLHNCVDVERFHPAVAPASDIGPPPGSTLFCAVGTLGRGVNKRVDICIRAIAAARARGDAVSLTICGDGEQRSELEQLTAQLGIAKYVRFLGTRPDIANVLAACDAFCHAAPFDPFPIACLEAMATGLPVIVPDRGGIREVVEAGRTGLIYPALNIEALAAAMSQLHHNPQQGRAMGAAVRRAVEERLSVRAYVERLYAIYGLQLPCQAGAAVA